MTDVVILDGARMPIGTFGGIALGHPVGMSGNRLLLTMAYELKHRRKKFGMISLCAGGGQGIAMVVQNLER